MSPIDVVLMAAWGAVCWMLGRWYQTGVMIQRLTHMTDQLPQTHSEHIAIRAEWVDNQVYLYVIETDEFLAQGADVDTAIDGITKSVPGCGYVLNKQMAEKPHTTQP